MLIADAGTRCTFAPTTGMPTEFTTSPEKSLPRKKISPNVEVGIPLSAEPATATPITKNIAQNVLLDIIRPFSLFWLLSSDEQYGCYQCNNESDPSRSWHLFCGWALDRCLLQPFCLFYPF